MKRLFRSRLPPPLTSNQINDLSKRSQLPEEEIQDWYERFNHCYTRGYLTCKEFIIYLKQLQNQNRNVNQPDKSMVKQLFRILDLNEDKQLNFEEFFLFHILANQGSVENKLKLILNLYDRDKEKNLTRQELENVLISMFDLLNLTKSKNNLSQKLDRILTHGHFNNQNTRISWHTFSTHILNHPSMFELLISNDINQNRIDNDSNVIRTRF